MASVHSDPRSCILPPRLHVLAVDHDLAALHILENMLLHCSYQVTTCHSAEDALYLLRENHACYDILITEIRLPGMSGFQLLEEALKLSDLPVIVFSTNLDHDMVKQVLCSGASYVLSKPISMDILKVIWQLAYHSKQTIDIWEVGSVDIVAPIKGFEEKRDATGISKKKQRYTWTEERHNLFIEALKVLGNDRAVPSKICKYMQSRRKDPYLSRHVIASHLQKFRGMKSEKQSEPPASDAPYWRNTVQHTLPLMSSGTPSPYWMQTQMQTQSHISPAVGYIQPACIDPDTLYKEFFQMADDELSPLGISYDVESPPY
ncbi:hypothetical protein MLD38_037576 [Melastoma candidum]|uniref:Uncharacterized protein n=1 Tax=Melastoma candidum TaxID=119954 RepID=A0ACB9LPW8_9MYRT|nr:hypothetical protein MLD38_037576 [Melastoma candidum]